MLEMFSFRFICSCISWTQYTWVYCLYVHVYMYLGYLGPSLYELRHDKTYKMAVRPAKTQISLGIRPVWSESSLSVWRSIGSLATHWAHSEDWSDWADAQADLSLRWAHSHFVGFVMSWLICNMKYLNGALLLKKYIIVLAQKIIYT